MNLNDVIILNPDYHFKNDLNRVLMYSKREVEPYSASEWIGFIHPVQAMILSLFTEQRTIKAHADVLCDYAKFSFDKSVNMIDSFLNKENSIYTEFHSEKVIFPKNVLIDYDKLNNKNIVHDIEIGDFDFKDIDLTPDRVHKSPLSFLFMLTSKCVTACKYCYADKKTTHEELTTAQVLNVIEEAKRLKMISIDVIGGEIFCKKDWNLILKSLVESDLSPYYLSTKVPITKNIANLLHQTGYKNVIQISLDSLDDENLNKIIGSGIGHVRKTKKGIDYLQEYNSKIQINTVLTKFNTTNDEMCKMYEYVKGIKNLIYWEIRVPEASIYTPDTFSDVKANREAIVKTCEYVRENIIPTSTISIIVNDGSLESNAYTGKCTDAYFKGGTCGVLKNRLFVLPDGKVSACEQLYWHPQFIIGDLKKQSFEEIWSSEKARSIFYLKQDDCRKTSQCSHCSIFDFCNGKHRKCWTKIIKAYGADHWDYPDPRCEYAPSFQSDLIYT